MPIGGGQEVASLRVGAYFDDHVTRGLMTLGDKIRYLGARMRNAGIGLTIAVTPLAMVFSGMVKDAMEYEAVSRGIATVSKATGRDVANVMAVIKKHSGELMSELDLTRGVLKLLSTSLTEVQIDEFIVMVKNGAAAMGEDMSVAFSMVSKGLKTYRMQNFDLIGVNERMVNIYKKVNKSLSETSKAYIYAIDRSGELTEEQRNAIIEQTLFNEVQNKSAVFTGIFAEYMRSTTGQVARLNTSMKDLGKDIGMLVLPRVGDLADKLSSIIKKIKNTSDEFKKGTGDALFYSTIIGIVSAAFFMFGGNLTWAVGQLLHLVKPLTGVLALITLIPFLAYKLTVAIGDLGVSVFDLAIILLKHFRQPLVDTTKDLLNFYNTIADIVPGLEPISRGAEEIFDDAITTLQELRDAQYEATRQFEKDPLGTIVGLGAKVGDVIGTAAHYGAAGVGGVIYGPTGAKLGADIVDAMPTASDVKDAVGGLLTDMTEFYGRILLGLIPGGAPGEAGVEGGVGAGAGVPTFAPPTGAGMPIGNLIIILPAADGTYGSPLNLGSISSLWERSGQDVVINAGTQNRPIV